MGEHDPVTAVEGWGFTGNSTKAHYFRDGTSLCGRWGFRSSNAPHEPDTGVSPDDCVGCRRALDKERALMGDPGLTTGEGTVSEPAARARAEHALTAWGEPYQGDGNLRSFTEALARDVLALTDELERVAGRPDDARVSEAIETLRLVILSSPWPKHEIAEAQAALGMLVGAVEARPAGPSPIECDGSPHCKAPTHLHGCYAERDEAILDAAAVQKRDREDSGERLTADELVRSQGFDPADFGLPLTGDGDADRWRERTRYLLTTDPSEWEPEVIRWLGEPE